MTHDTPAVENYDDGQVVERGHNGRFVGGTLTPEEAKARGSLGGRKPKDILVRAKRLLEQHPSTAGTEWDDQPEAAKLLAEMAARQETGGLAALQTFLNSPEMVGLAKQRQAAVTWDGNGPCPTCKRLPDPYLEVADRAAVHLVQLLGKRYLQQAARMRAAYERGETVVYDATPIGRVQVEEFLAGWQAANGQL